MAKKAIVSAIQNKLEKTPKEKLDELGTEGFCDLILEGHSCRGIAQRMGISLGSMNYWIESDVDRSQACAKAREAAAQTYDEIAVELIEQAQDQFALAKAKELAVHYRWRAKAINPRKYGDKLQSDMNLNVTLFNPDQVQRMAALING